MTARDEGKSFLSSTEVGIPDRRNHMQLSRENRYLCIAAESLLKPIEWALGAIQS